MAVNAMSPAGDMSGLRDMIRTRYARTAAPAPAPAPTGMARVGGLQPFQMAGAAPTAAAQPTPVNATAGAPPPPPITPTADNASNLPGPGNADFGGGAIGSISSILRDFLSGGAFAPGPNAGIMAFIRQKALEDAAAQRAHAALVAQSSGADPATAASYGLQADLASQGGVSKAVSDATYGELTHSRDFGQQLLELLLGKQGTQNAYNPVSGAQWASVLSSLIPHRGSN